MKSALYELYYREGCDQKGWAYISLKDIGDGRDLVFRKGSHKINVRIMESIVPEIKEISKRANNSRFMFNYLACKVGERDRYDAMVANPTALCWVKMKGKFSSDQIDALEKIKLPLAVFHIVDVLEPPRKIEMEWDIRSGQEWLDEIDDLRDQAEYDDEYF